MRRIGIEDQYNVTRMTVSMLKLSRVLGAPHPNGPILDLRHWNMNRKASSEVMDDSVKDAVRKKRGEAMR